MARRYATLTLGFGIEPFEGSRPEFPRVATYDRIFTFSGDETSQLGIALRYGFGD